MKRLLWLPWLRLLVIPQAMIVQPLAQPRPSVCPTGHGVDVRGVAPDPDLQLRVQDDCLAPLAPCGCPKFLIQRFLQVICRYLLAATAFVIHDQQCVSIPLGKRREERYATHRTSGVMLGVDEDVERDLPDGQRLVTGQQPAQRVFHILVGGKDHEVSPGHPSTPAASRVPRSASPRQACR